MSAFDLTPPSLPGTQHKKGGFLKRFFMKEEPMPAVTVPIAPAPNAMQSAGANSPGPAQSTTPPPATAADAKEPLDLEEIKRKLGLDDEEANNAPHAEPPRPTQSTPERERRVEIHDWATDNAKVTANTAHAVPQELQEETTVSTTPSTSTTGSLIPDDLTKFSESSEDKNETHEETREIAVHETTDHDLPLPPLARDHSLTLHKEVEAHLMEIDTAHQKIRATIKKVTEDKPTLPDWMLQQKEVPQGSYFMLRNGQPIKSLNDLLDAIAFIDDSTFEHHVNEYRNDFANWIKDVIEDAELAQEVQNAKTREDIMTALNTHQKESAKTIIKSQEKLQQVVTKRQETVKKLLGVEDQIAALKERLDQKSKELEGERHHTAQLIKGKLEVEVARRLEGEKKALIAARSELSNAKKEQLGKKEEYEMLIASLNRREAQIAQREKNATTSLVSAKEERAKLAKEKDEARRLLQDADQLKRQFEEMKKLDRQNKDSLIDISKHEIDISRREETIRQREKKITEDLTRVHHEKDALAKTREECNKREQEVLQAEIRAKKIEQDAEKRAEETLKVERGSKTRIQADIKKLETLRGQIDKSLSKALGQKKKITSAIALRKHLEMSIGTLKQEVVEERKELEEDAFKTYFEEQVATTPAGQPLAPKNEEILDAGKHELPIYRKIQACRQALERKDIATARSLYNELREEFANVTVETGERNTMYNSIRELYDDIHLMMLN